MASKKLIEKIVEQLIDGNWDDAPLLYKAVEATLEHVEEHGVNNTMLFRDNFTGQVFEAYRADDARAYVNDDRAEITACPVVKVPNGYAAHAENIRRKRDRLQAEVDELNRRLKERDVH